MEENQKNQENKQKVSEMKNITKEGTGFFIKEGAIKDQEGFLDPGYRFLPTDEELIIQYLKPKNLNQPLPTDIVKTVNLYQYSPQQLFEEYKEKVMYFFTLRNRKYPGGSRPSRAAGNGYWKGNIAATPIGNKDQPIAYKTVLVFHEGTHKHSTKTGWLMHEFVDKKNAPSTSESQQEMQLDGWVLCKVYKSAKKGNNPKQSNLQPPPPVGSLPPESHYVNSQRPAHTGESSFPKPQVDQNPLVPIRPHPPGLHNFNHLISAHTGGYSIPMLRSNQDLLSTRSSPSEMHKTRSWMPGNSGQTSLPKPDQPGFQNFNSQMAAHNTGESCYPRPPPDQPGFLNVNSQMAAHNTGQSCYPRPPPDQPGFLNVNSQMAAHNTGQSCYPRPPPDQPGFLNVNSQMAAHNTGQSCYPKPLRSQDPLLLNNAHPSGMYNTYSHMAQLPPSRPTIPHPSGPHCFPKLQTNQHPPLSKRPRLSGMHNVGYTEKFWFPEPQPNKDFMPPTRPAPQYTDYHIIADMQRSCYPESPHLPDGEHDYNQVPSFEHHNNIPKADEEVSSEFARDEPSQHGLQEKDDKQLGS